MTLPPSVPAVWPALSDGLQRLGQRGHGQFLAHLDGHFLTGCEFERQFGVRDEHLSGLALFGLARRHLSSFALCLLSSLALLGLAFCPLNSGFMLCFLGSLALLGLARCLFSSGFVLCFLGSLALLNRYPDNFICGLPGDVLRLLFIKVLESVIDNIVSAQRKQRLLLRNQVVVFFIHFRFPFQSESRLCP